MDANEQNKEKSTDSEEKESKAKKIKGNKVEINGKLYNIGRWTDEEHNKFMEGIKIFGKDWKKVQQYVGTRTSAQSRSHAQKVLTKTPLTGDNCDDSYSLKSRSDQRSNKGEYMEPKVEVESNTIDPINYQKFKTPSIDRSHIIEAPMVVSRKRLHSHKEDN